LLYTNILSNVRYGFKKNITAIFSIVKVTRGPRHTNYTTDNRDVNTIDVIKTINNASIFKIDQVISNITIVTGELVDANGGDWFAKGPTGELYKIGESQNINKYYTLNTVNPELRNTYTPKPINAILVTEAVLDSMKKNSTVKEVGTKLQFTVINNNKETRRTNLIGLDDFIIVDDGEFCMGSSKEFIVYNSDTVGGKKMKAMPKPSPERVKNSNGQNRIVYVGPKGGKYIKKDGKFVRV